MRCNTPKIRVSAIGFRVPFSKKGNQYIKKPKRKIIEKRLKIFLRKVPSPIASYFFILKLIALPTTNKKVGKTKSVNVNPFHSACFNMPKLVSPFPGELTIIIRATSIPLKTSKERYLFFNVFILVGLVVSKKTEKI